MNAAHVRDAARLWAALDEVGKKLAKDELAPRIRSTGLEATLRWLDSARPPPRLLGAFCNAAGIPADGAARSIRSNQDLLNDNRRALALAEALHVVARTENR